MSKTINIKDFKIHNFNDTVFKDGKLKPALTIMVNRGDDNAFSLFFYDDDSLEENKKNLYNLISNYNPIEISNYLKSLPSDQTQVGSGLLSDIQKARQNNLKTQKTNSGGKKVYKGNSKYQGKYDQLPIFALIESMIETGYIKIVDDLKSNGSETKYKIEINSETRTINDNLLISTVSRDQYGQSPEKANFYIEFKNYFKSSRGSAGEYNFMNDFERLGAFGEPVKLSDYADKEEYDIAVKEKIKPILRDLRRTFFQSNEKGFIIDQSSFVGGGSKINLPQTMYKPMTYNPKIKAIRELKTILSKRGFSEKIIDDSVKKGVIRFGSNIHPKMGFTSYGIFANMHNPLDPKYPKGYEVFFSQDQKKLTKMFASIKRTIKDKEYSKTGTSYILGCDFSESKKVDGTIFSEAVLDSIAMKDIMSFCNKDYEQYNHISVQGVGNMVNFFKETFGFYYQQSNIEAENIKEGDIWVVDKEFEKLEMKDDLLDRTKEKFKDLKVKFIFDKSKKGSSKQLFKLRKFFEHLGINNNIEVFDVNYSGMKVELGKSKDDGIYIMDNTNVHNFFEENDIIVDYLKDNKGYAYFIERKNEKERPFDPEKDDLSEFRKRVLSVLKSPNVYLSFDNDVAGLHHYKPVSKMLKKIGLNCSATIPPFHSFDNKGSDKFINDNNDVLMFIRYLEGLNKFPKKQIADWVEEKFLSGMSNDMDYKNIDSSIALANKVSEVESNKKLTQNQKGELLKQISQKPSPPQIIGRRPNS